MSKKPKLQLVTPTEEETEFFKKQYLNLGELNGEIEKLEGKVPDKRTKEYEFWKIKYNFLVDTYNKLGNFKSFKRIE